MMMMWIREIETCLYVRTDIIHFIHFHYVCMGVRCTVKGWETVAVPFQGKKVYGNAW